MAEEMDAGVAYLTALKKLSVTESATTPAADTTQRQSAERDIHTTATVPHDGAEKRRSPRYTCEGGVQLAEEGSDVHTWAKFTDISLHGCYVEAQATYPVGTCLNMKMELNGVRLETKGTVRVNYPCLGMGIAFVDMSDQNHERLKNLLNNVSYSRVIVGTSMTAVVPAGGPLGPPAIANPAAAIRTLVDFFQNRHILTREDFFKIVASEDREPKG